jgi:hypothetical protein
VLGENGGEKTIEADAFAVVGDGDDVVCQGSRRVRKDPPYTV